MSQYPLCACITSSAAIDDVISSKQYILIHTIRKNEMQTVRSFRCYGSLTSDGQAVFIHPDQVACVCGQSQLSEYRLGIS